MRQKKQCSVCNKNKYIKSILRNGDKIICRKCYRGATSFSALSRAQRESKPTFRKSKTPMSSSEQRYLLSQYKKNGMSYNEGKKRLNMMKQQITESKILAKANKVKPSFKEEFKKLKGEK